MRATKGPRMHEENRFFRILWRVNAVLLALAGLLAAGLLAAAAAGMLFSGFGRRDEPVPMKSAAGDKVRFELAPEGTPLQGTTFMLFTLNRERSAFADEGSFSGRGNTGQDANYLIVDSGTASGTWLFAHETQAIWSRLLLYKTPSADGGDVVTAMILTVTDADTDQDGALTGRDRQSLCFYRPGAARAVKFFTADNIWSVRQVDADRFSVVYGDGGKTEAAVFSTHDVALLRKSVLPAYPK